MIKLSQVAGTARLLIFRLLAVSHIWTPVFYGWPFALIGAINLATSHPRLHVRPQRLSSDVDRGAGNFRGVRRALR
jgi:hypothetical protein